VYPETTVAISSPLTEALITLTAQVPAAIGMESLSGSSPVEDALAPFETTWAPVERG
jgi:hypothetical protein